MVVATDQLALVCYMQFWLLGLKYTAVDVNCCSCLAVTKSFYLAFMSFSHVILQEILSHVQEKINLSVQKEYGTTQAGLDHVIIQIMFWIVFLTVLTFLMNVSVDAGA